MPRAAWRLRAYCSSRLRFAKRKRALSAPARAGTLETTAAPSRPLTPCAWSIRYQLLVPLLTLLVGVAGMSTWTALASAGRCARQIETQMHRIVHTVNKFRYPLKENVLLQMKELSGADYLLVDSDGHRWTTLPSADVSLPAPDPRLPTAGRSTWIGA